MLSRLTMDADVFQSCESAQGGDTAQALDLHTEGKEHLNPPHSIWHGHGRVLLVLVAVHLAAFLYWCGFQAAAAEWCCPFNWLSNCAYIAHVRSAFCISCLAC